LLFVGVTAPVNPSDTALGVTPVSPTEPTPELFSSTILEASTHLRTIHSSFPSRSALLIFTGHSDPRRMSELNDRKAAFEAEIRMGLPTEHLGESERWWAQI
jgi:RNA exonuclease 1